MAAAKVTELDILKVVELIGQIPKLQIEVLTLTQEMSFWREVAMSKQWVDRKQAKEILGMCDVTLQRVSNDTDSFKADTIRRRYTGSKPFFSIEDIRLYLGYKKGLDINEASRRIIRNL